MGNLFRPDAFLWRWCSRLLDVMVLSILWLFCSVPLATAGAASAALYDAAVHGIRRELRTAVPAALLWGAALAGLLWFGRLIGTVIQEPGPVLAAAAVFAALLASVLVERAFQKHMGSGLHEA